MEGLIGFLAGEPDGFADLIAVDKRRINEAAASRTAAAVSAFFVPDKAISPVVIAVFDPGSGGYRGFEDAATIEINAPFWMVFNAGFFRPIFLSILRQNVWVYF